MTKIASTAVIDTSAQLGEDVEVGPGAVIGAGVTLGAGCTIKANVVIEDRVTLGKRNRVFPNCVLGEEPQTLHPDDGETQLIIGDDNTFRENVTVHRGSSEGVGKTVIGTHCYFMVGSHIAHDCRIEDHVVISNATLLSGHVTIEHHAWLGAICGVHQFSTVGHYAYIAGASTIHRDIPPYVRAAGAYPCEVRGLNLIGLERAGFSEQSIKALREAYHPLYKRCNGTTFLEQVDRMRAREDLDEHVASLLESLHRSSQHRMGRYQEIFRK
jgi:UDP-N-acetylglucosamine acyltransferase